MNLDAVIREIDKANADEIEVLMDAVFARKSILFPKWDINFFALPEENWDEREQILQNMVRLEHQNRKLLEGKKEYV